VGLLGGEFISFVLILKKAHHPILNFATLFSGQMQRESPAAAAG
jgi:hypothetical protein